MRRQVRGIGFDLDLLQRHFPFPQVSAQEILEAFAEASEERNRRLGLGWESEIGLNPFTGRRKD